MKFDLCPGDRVLVLHETSLGYGGSIHVAVIDEVKRVTATQVIVGNDRYRKDDGRKVGGKGELLDPDNPTHYDRPIEVMTREEANGLYSQWIRFEDAIRDVLGRQAPSYGIGNMFGDKGLRKAVLEEADRHYDAITSLYESHKCS